jgi:hypothetical protein
VSCIRLGDQICGGLANIGFNAATLSVPGGGASPREALIAVH